MIYTRSYIASMLDLACLKPPVTLDDVNRTINLALKEKCAAVCAPAVYSKRLVYALKDTSVRSCVVVGFPFGYGAAKLDEARRAIEWNVREIDYVIDYGLFLSGETSAIRLEVNRLVRFCEDESVHLKAILETCYLTPEQIRDVSKICVGEGVDWLKTSTGFGSGGATPEAVKIMLDACRGTYCQVKASGGIKTPEVAKMYLDMGCRRLGVGSLDCLPNEKD